LLQTPPAMCCQLFEGALPLLGIWQCAVDLQGQDISGACGQLVVEASQVSIDSGKGHRPLADIEEVGRQRLNISAH
jgi:hypothetical protein